MHPRIFLLCSERSWCVEYCRNAYRCHLLDVAETNLEFEEREQGSNWALSDRVRGQLGHDSLTNPLYGVLPVVIQRARPMSATSVHVFVLAGACHAQGAN